MRRSFNSFHSFRMTYIFNACVLTSVCGEYVLPPMMQDAHRHTASLRNQSADWLWQSVSRKSLPLGEGGKRRMWGCNNPPVCFAACPFTQAMTANVMILRCKGRCLRTRLSFLPNLCEKQLHHRKSFAIMKQIISTMGFVSAGEEDVP